MMRCKIILLFLTVTAFCLAAGCDPVLETGYKPRALNASPAARQAYYAPAFTPEAMPEKKDEGDSGPGFGLGK
jgi:hypothetical protein